MVSIPPVWGFILLAIASGALVAAGIGALYLVSKVVKKSSKSVNLNSDATPTNSEPTSKQN